MGVHRVSSSTPGFAVVREERCSGCGICASVCTYGAIGMRETARGGKAVVDPALCRGDGLCSSLCATGAMEFQEPSRSEVFQQIDEAAARA